MKAFILILFVFSVFVSAGSVNVLSSFYSPDWFPNGLAWDGTYLWLLGGHYDTFYQISTGGTVVDFFTPSEPGGNNGSGAMFDGTNLWGLFLENTSSPSDAYEYTTSGAFVSTFTCPGTYSPGLTWDGSSIWMSCRGTQMIYEFNKSGFLLSSFPISYTGLADMAWNGTNLFVCAKDDKLIVEISTVGTVIDTYDVSGISGSFSPTALTFDGSNFWVSNQTSDIIYEIELVGVALQRSTFGSIKAMFMDPDPFQR